MLNLEECKLEICCSISGLDRYLTHLSMLFKEAVQLRCEQLGSQRYLLQCSRFKDTLLLSRCTSFILRIIISFFLVFLSFTGGGYWPYTGRDCSQQSHVHANRLCIVHRAFLGKGICYILFLVKNLSKSSAVSYFSLLLLYCFMEIV